MFFCRKRLNWSTRPPLGIYTVDCMRGCSSQKNIEFGLVDSYTESTSPCMWVSNALQVFLTRQLKCKGRLFHSGCLADGEIQRDLSQPPCHQSVDAGKDWGTLQSPSTCGTVDPHTKTIKNHSAANYTRTCRGQDGRVWQWNIISNFHSRPP